MTHEIALIGFGEAGSTFARSGNWAGRAVAFDIADARRPAMEAVGLAPCRTAAEAVEGASLVLSLVTADQALCVARDCAMLIAEDAIFCDMNSVAPGTKRRAAQAFANAGRRYVDVAVMAPVDPAHMAVPLTISGPDANTAKQLLRAAGFTQSAIVGDAIGRASAIKLVRSVMVKGLEALTAEMMLAATAEGVVEEVLASLNASEKAIGWPRRANYNLDRMLVHGRRRSAEMAEAARMLQDLGIAPLMTDGAVARQDLMGRLGLNPPPDTLAGKLAALSAATTTKNHEPEGATP